MLTYLQTPTGLLQHTIEHILIFQLQAQRSIIFLHSVAIHKETKRGCLYSFPLCEGIKDFRHLRTLFDLEERFLSRLVVGLHRAVEPRQESWTNVGRGTHVCEECKLGNLDDSSRLFSATKG